MRTHRALFGIAAISLVGVGAAIDITPTHDGTILGDAIFGNVASGITLQSSTYIGADQAAAKYRNLDFAPFAKMRSGILLTTGNALIAQGPTISSTPARITAGRPAHS